MENLHRRIIAARKEAASILYKVINNEIAAKDAIDSYYDKLSGIDDSVDCALHALYHYRDDEDIRKKDKKYADSQINDLKSMAGDLSQGLSVSRKQVSFYTPRVFGMKAFLAKIKKMFWNK